ncbi:MAG: glycosyltransferase family 8 protein [Clostridia bacterium]|nr:glycosyltransferase family 8 protein [Clostridia bacterium]
MNILCCVDDNYAYPLINFMFSIRKYCDREINLYVLSTKLSDKIRDRIKEKCEEININVNIQVVDLDDKIFAARAHYTKDTFLRLFAYKFLPQEMDKLLYLDVDTLCLGDVGELYDIDINNYILAACRDKIWDLDRTIEHGKELGIEHDMFNAGIILFNMKKVRKLWDEKLVVDMIEKAGKKLLYLDQDLLNMLTKKEDILFLDNKMNFQLRCFEKVKNLDGVVIMHYLEDRKPWNHYILAYHEKLFWKNFKETGCKEFYEISRRMRRQKLIRKFKNKFKRIFGKK